MHDFDTLPSGYQSHPTLINFSDLLGTYFFINSLNSPLISCPSGDALVGLYQLIKITVKYSKETLLIIISYHIHLSFKVLHSVLRPESYYCKLQLFKSRLFLSGCRILLSCKVLHLVRGPYFYYFNNSRFKVPFYHMLVSFKVLHLVLTPEFYHCNNYSGFQADSSYQVVT